MSRRAAVLALATAFFAGAHAQDLKPLSEGELLKTIDGIASGDPLTRQPLSIGDLDKPQRYIQVRGRVVEITEEGANAVIDQLAMKYNGCPYNHQAGQTRVTYKIRPDHVQPRG